MACQHYAGSGPTANVRANLKELMARMGHDSERAAFVYLHSSAKRQRTLADAVGKAASAEFAKSKPRKAAKLEGTQRARNRRPGAGGGV